MAQTKNTNKRTIPNQRDTARPEFRVSHVFQFDDGGITFWLHYGRCTIYGCRIAHGDNGEFIAFPSRKVEAKRRGETAKYYSHAYIPLDMDESCDIINMVYDAIENPADD